MDFFSLASGHKTFRVRAFSCILQPLVTQLLCYCNFGIKVMDPGETEMASGVVHV